MTSRIGRLAMTVVGAASCSLMCGYAVHNSEYWKRRNAATETSPESPTEQLQSTSSSTPKAPVASSASALTGSVVDAVLRDGNTVDNVVVLLKDVFTHKIFLQHVKEHFRQEFTSNEETVDALKTFLLRDILNDAFVSDQLTGVAKDLGTHLMEHPLVYPGPTLELLKDAALDALRTDRFHNELISALNEGGKHALFLGRGDASSEE